MSKAEFARDLGMELRLQREHLGVTQAAVAEGIGVSASAVSGWERGIAVPDAHAMTQLKTFFRRLRARQCGASAADAREYADSIARVHP